MNHKMTITTPIGRDAQASQRLELPRPAVLGIATGIFFLTFFGAYWGFISAAFMSGSFQTVAFPLVGLVTLGFIGVSGIILRYARTLPKTLPPENAALRKRISMWFGIIFGSEFILIAFANILPIAGKSPYNWSLFVGIGTTLILWLTALYITRFGFKVMKKP